MRAALLYFIFLSTLALSIGLAASGCSSNTPAFEGIANRGVTPVSSQSPFIGSNVFLAQEMEKSVYLYNFMNTRGAPQAIQVLGSQELDSELLMFYSKEREYYSAVPKVDPQTKAKEWIIRGPFAITREHYPAVAHLNSSQGGVFEIFGRQEVLGGPVRAIDSRIIQPAFVPTPAATPVPKKRKAKKSAKDEQNTGTGPSIAVQGTPINLDQEALYEARRKAAAIPSVAPTAAVTVAPSTSPKAADATKRPSLEDALNSAIRATPAPTTALTAAPSAAKK
jgi:hypothetical protein